MSTTITFNGNSYAFPTSGDTGWGTTVTNWAADVSSHTVDTVNTQNVGGNKTFTGTVTFSNPFAGFHSTGITDNAVSTVLTLSASNNVVLTTGSKFTGFKSTGIDDTNAVGTALSIDASGNLVISGAGNLTMTSGNLTVGGNTVHTGTTAFTGNITGAVTMSGALTLSTTPLALTSGGTGATTASAARTALGLGTSATVNTGTSGATIPLLNAANTWGATQTLATAAVNETSASITLASATSVAIGAATGNYITITNGAASSITSFDTVQAGTERTLEFASATTLTNSASVILPGAANIVTVAGDTAKFRSEGSGNWRCVGYTRMNPTPPVKGTMQTGTDNTQPVTAARVNDHDGVAKAWAFFNGTTVGTNAPTAGYGVTSITRNGTGDYTVTFATAFANTNYIVVGMPTGFTVGQGTRAFQEASATTARTTTTIRLNNVSNAGSEDAVAGMIVAFGRQ